MSPFKMQIVAQLALSRAKLFRSLLGLRAEQLEQPIWEDWSARTLLVHIGRWDAFEAVRLQALIDGRVDETHSVEPDQLNAKWAAQDVAVSLDAAVAIVQKERNGFLNVIAGAEDDLLRSTVTLSDGYELFATQGINNSIEHDDDHAADIKTWRKANGLFVRGQVGDRNLIIAGLRASRNAVLETAKLAQMAGSESGWSADQLLAHLAGWEQFLLDAIENGVAAHGIADADAINQRFVAEWGGRDVIETYKRLRRQLLALIERHDLSAKIVDPENPENPLSVYEWLAGYMGHDREHADEMFGAWLRKQRTK